MDTTMMDEIMENEAVTEATESAVTTAVETVKNAANQVIQNLEPEKIYVEVPSDRMNLGSFVCGMGLAALAFIGTKVGVKLWKKNKEKKAKEGEAIEAEIVEEESIDGYERNEQDGSDCAADDRAYDANTVNESKQETKSEKSKK